MSTNAIIKIEGIDYACLYKHFDGYPEATYPWLVAFNRDFTSRRGVDSEYKFAQLVRSSVRDAEKYGLDDSSITGWGVLSGLATGCYMYVLKNDGTVDFKTNTEY